MSEEDTVMLLKEISRKLDQLIILTRMGRQEEIDKIRRKIKSDPVLSEICKLSDGSLSSSQIKSVVAKTKNKAEATVEGKIYELVKDGVIVPIRKGREIYYVTSGLID